MHHHQGISQPPQKNKATKANNLTFPIHHGSVLLPSQHAELPPSPSPNNVLPADGRIVNLSGDGDVIVDSLASSIGVTETTAEYLSFLGDE